MKKRKESVAVQIHSEPCGCHLIMRPEGKFGESVMFANEASENTYQHLTEQQLQSARSLLSLRYNASSGHRRSPDIKNPLCSWNHVFWDWEKFLGRCEKRRATQSWVFSSSPPLVKGTIYGWYLVVALRRNPLALGECHEEWAALTGLEGGLFKKLGCVIECRAAGGGSIWWREAKKIKNIPTKNEASRGSHKRETHKHQAVNSTHVVNCEL